MNATCRHGVVPRCLVIAVLFLCRSFAETVPDRAGAVRNDKSAMEKDPRWIYNDWRRGFKEAAAKKKPLLVVLRCVPCLSCMGIDASVLTAPELAPLLDEFVCVRVINANALDLTLFQFDYDLSFSTMFFSADGTVYGRYGSWTHQKNASDKTFDDFKRALEATLTIHRGYPANKARLTGKQGLPMPFKDPLEIPELAGKYKRELDWEGKVVQSCVHCHKIGDAVRSSYRDQKKSIPLAWVYPMPSPETLGLQFEPGELLRIQSVAEGSTAARSGLQGGDQLLSLLGEPLVSVADVAWVLHRAPETGSLPVIVKRSGVEQPLTLVLPTGWRMKSDISRRVAAWPMRAMATGGLLLEDLPNNERTRRGFQNNEMALLVKHAGEYGSHAAAKKAGFQKGDVITQLAGMSARITESELIGRLLQKHAPGDKVPAIVMRGKDRIELSLPIQ
jgi:serine protease Do